MGTLAIYPLTLIGETVRASVCTLAARRGVRRTRLLVVPVQSVLVTAYALLTVYGRAWLGAIAVVGAALQCLITVAVTVRPTVPFVSGPSKMSTTGATTVAKILRMSEQGRAAEALALLDQSVVAAENEHAFLLLKALCAYRAGAFEESMELDRRLAEGGWADKRTREVAAADARLSAALRDSRAVTPVELDECSAAILGPGLPDWYAKDVAYAHSKALLALASGEAETAMHAGVGIVADRSIVPANRALVVAMIVIAAARAGHLDVARFWELKVPDWCPLRPAVERELGIRSPDDADGPGDNDADCVFID